MSPADGSACPVCQHFACVCEMRSVHKADCLFRIAATGAVGIACEPHGRDCCPTCDPCTCGAGWGAGVRN